jgi:hypothetical protein
MPPFHKQYGTTEGPLGLPMTERQARALEAILKNLPQEERKLSHRVTRAPPSELLDGERADVSWISTEEIDRDREIMIARGMNDAHFKLNPLVTLQHCYQRPAVGRSLWRKRVRDGQKVGIKAKTVYPPRPDDWTEEVWPSDSVFTLIRAGLLSGKSVGFITLKSHAPGPQEMAARPELADVYRIIDEWLLLEYACVYLPANQSAVVEAVSKSGLDPRHLQVLGLEIPVPVPPVIPPNLPPAGPQVTSFTALEEIGKEVQRALEKLNLSGEIARKIEEGYHHLQGRV